MYDKFCSRIIQKNYVKSHFVSFVNQRKETFLSKASDLSESKMEFENKFTAAKGTR